MSAFPPPTNGYFNGATYNSAYFNELNTTSVTKEYLEENYLPRVGAPTDLASLTTFTGQLLVENKGTFDNDIVLAGTQGTQAIQYPNGSRQTTAMNTLPTSQIASYATVTTDTNGAISAVTPGTGVFPMDVVLSGTQGTRALQFPNSSKQYTAMNTLPISQVSKYATVTTDTNGAISAITAGDGIFPMDVVLSGTQGTRALQFPNASKQYTAMNTLPASQTYTYPTITTDANGAIKTITSNTISNALRIATAYRTTTLTWLNFGITVSGGVNGPWAQNEFFTIKYSISVDYNASTTSPFQFQSYGTANGVMDIYPYRFGTGWCSNNNAPSIAQLPNAINGNSNYNMVDTGVSPAGGTIAPSGRQFWSYPSATIGGLNTFYVNGSTNTIIFQIVNPSGFTSTASYTVGIEFELLNSGANKSTISSTYFDTNF